MPTIKSVRAMVLAAATFSSAAIVAAAPDATAGTKTVAWTGSSIVGDHETITVTPFSADGFLGTIGSGTFDGNFPGVQQRLILSVEIGGVFQAVSQTGVGVSGSLNTLLPSGSFPAGTIDAIELTDVNLFGDPNGGDADVCAFFSACAQSLNTVSFVFSTPEPTAAPEPASVLLLAAGIAGLTSARRRRPA